MRFGFFLPMLSLHTLMIYAPVAAIVVMMPGPDFALITKIALQYGRRQGTAAAIGIACGIAVHTTAAIIGISAIIVSSVTLFTMLKFAGAAYLFWLGVKTLLGSFEQHSPSGHEIDVQSSPVMSAGHYSLWHFMRQGFFCNLLNPKAVLFFLTFIPQFMDVHQPLGPQFLGLGGFLGVFCLCWFSSLSYLLGFVRRYFLSATFQKWLNRCTGLIFIAFGVNLILSKVSD